MTTIFYLCICHGIASLVEILLICRPITTQRDPDIQGICGNQVASYVTIEVSALILDVALVAYSILIFARLQYMELRKKLVVILLLNTGVL